MSDLKTPEKTESPDDCSTKKPEKTESQLRAAHCLECTNEWYSRKGSAKKPARCPECGSTRCTWKDELDKLGGVLPEKPLKTTAKPPEKTESPELTDMKKPEKTEKPEPHPDEGMFSGFLQSDENVKKPEKTESQGDGKTGVKTDLMQGLGLPLPVLLAVIVAICILGGGLWFLGRGKKPAVPAVRYVPAPPTKGSAAAMRLEGVA
jgi:hypothetical protein